MAPPAAAASSTSADTTAEEKARTEEEKKHECPICKMMREGGCDTQFHVGGLSASPCNANSAAPHSLVCAHD